MSIFYSVLRKKNIYIHTGLPAFLMKNPEFQNLSEGANVGLGGGSPSRRRLMGVWR